MFRAHRGRLEALLRQGVDVCWGRGVADLHPTSSGVQLQMSNDSSFAPPGIVVGADGAHSTIRKTLLPAAELKVLPYVVFNGKRKLARDAFDTLFAPSFTLARSTLLETRVRRNGVGVLVQLALADMDDAHVTLSWTYARRARGSPSSDPLYRPGRAAAAAGEIPEAFYQEVAEVAELGELGTPFDAVMDADVIRKDRVLGWLMRVSDPLPRGCGGLDGLEGLEAKGVVLVGDAVHAQPILGGEGANVAIVDAVELAERIGEGRGALRGWYEERVPVWREGMERCVRRLEEMVPEAEGTSTA